MPAAEVSTNTISVKSFVFVTEPDHTGVPVVHGPPRMMAASQLMPVRPMSSNSKPSRVPSMPAKTSICQVTKLESKFSCRGLPGCSEANGETWSSVPVCALAGTAKNVVMPSKAAAIVRGGSIPGVYDRIRTSGKSQITQLPDAPLARAAMKSME